MIKLQSIILKASNQTVYIIWPWPHKLFGGFSQFWMVFAAKTGKNMVFLSFATVLFKTCFCLAKTQPSN